MCRPESRPEALDLMRHVVARLDKSALPRTDAYFAIYGSLLLKGSIAAARSGLEDLARDLHSAASETAEELGEEFTRPWALFGPANVAIHEVSMLIDLHEGGRAVEAARSLPQAQLAKLSTERRARHKLDVAAGLMQAGRRDEAAEELWKADQLARTEVRGRALAKRLVIQILHDYPVGLMPPVTITSLARDVTIAV
jgi:hypothetical protein